MAIAALCLVAARPAVALTWSTYEAARLDTDRYYDGDSFHVITPRKTYIFRLYFVDAPETDDAFEERVKDQARYWHIEEADVLRLGKAAKRFTRDFLRKGFTAWTRRQDAEGRSAQPRYFAVIRAGDTYLSEALVSNGLARVYGKPTELPDGTPERKYWSHLDRLERDAREAGRGAWGLRAPTGHVPPAPAVAPVAEGERQLARTVAVFDPADPSRLLGMLRRGARVTVLDAASAGLVRIRFRDGEAEREGLCRRSALVP